MKQNKEMFIIKIVLLLFIIVNTFMFLSYTNLIKVIENYTEQVINMQDTITEFSLQLEAYSDNYVALWTTVNTYHNEGGNN